MHSVIVACCLVMIIALAPYPTGLWLGRRYPHVDSGIAQFRAPILAAASTLMAAAIGSREPTVPHMGSIWAGSIGIAVMLLVDGICLLFLLRRVQPRLLGVYAEDLPCLDTVAGRLKFALTNAFASVWEELVFRYLPYYLIGDVWWGYTCAVLLSSALFGMQHVRQGTRQVAYSFGIGIFFSILVWSTGSIWASICAHFAGNAFTAIIARKVMLRSSRGYVAPF